jgi:prepilin-type N-terminal cleavage/methylation domain-containing protein
MLSSSYRRPSHGRQRGYSLVELMIVVAVVVTLSAMAIMNITRPTTTNRANAAVDAVVDSLRQARQLAISKRRNVVVAFNGTNQIQLTVQPLPGEAVPLTIPIVKLNGGSSNSMQFLLFPSLPNTPMGPLGFGNTSALDFEAVNGGTVGTALMFSTSGSLVGAGGAAAANWYAVGNNDPINATIFIGIPGDSSTARAITIVGATGRVRSFAWNGAAWQE